MACEYLNIRFDEQSTYPIVGCAYGNHWHVTPDEAVYAMGLDPPNYPVPAIYDSDNKSHFYWTMPSAPIGNLIAGWQLWNASKNK